jgi:hypothetical protein
MSCRVVPVGVIVFWVAGVLIAAISEWHLIPVNVAVLILGVLDGVVLSHAVTHVLDRGDDPLLPG